MRFIRVNYLVGGGGENSSGEITLDTLSNINLYELIIKEYPYLLIETVDHNFTSVDIKRTEKIKRKNFNIDYIGITENVTNLYFNKSLSIKTEESIDITIIPAESFDGGFIAIGIILNMYFYLVYAENEEMLNQIMDTLQ